MLDKTFQNKFYNNCITSNYGLKVLETGCDEISKAEVGNRNTTLSKNSIKILSFVKGNEINKKEAEDKLTQAARKTGLPYNEISNTINSAWKVAVVKKAPVLSNNNILKSKEGKILNTDTNIYKILINDKRWKIRYNSFTDDIIWDNTPFAELKNEYMENDIFFMSLSRG